MNQKVVFKETPQNHCLSFYSEWTQTKVCWLALSNKLPQQVDTPQALVNKNPLISRVLEACYCLTQFGIWGCTKFSVLKQWPSHFLFPKPNKLLHHPRATSAKKFSLRLSNIYRRSKHYELDLIWYTGSIQGIIGRHRDEATTRASAYWMPRRHWTPERRHFALTGKDYQTGFWI